MGLLSSINKITGGSFLPFSEGGWFDKYHNSTSGKSQQDEANAMAMKSWQLANDYNHPIQQMERLKAAGLNPNLVYGSGSVAGNTTSAPSLVGGGVSTKTESAIRGLGQVLEFVQGKANIDQTRASTQASAAAAGASSAQAANLNAQTAINTTKAQYEQDALIADIDYKRALARETNAKADMAEGEAQLFGATGGAKGAVSIGSGIKNTLKAVRGIFK